MPDTPLLVDLPENTRGRDFVVADLHGHIQPLERELAARRFDPACDRVLSVGDLIDRGPESARVLELLAAPWFFSVRGNHEQAMLGWIDAVLAGVEGSELQTLASRHFLIGGDWALPLFARARRQDLDELKQWQQALQRLPYALSTSANGRRIGIVHAGVPGGDWDFFQQPDPDPRDLLATLWTRRPHQDHPVGVRGINTVYAGHNQVPAVRSFHNFKMIETAVWAGGPLTLIEISQAQTASTPAGNPPARRWWSLPRDAR